MSEVDGTQTASCSEWPRCGCGGQPCKLGVKPALKIDRDKLFDRIERDAEAGYDGNDCAGAAPVRQTTHEPTPGLETAARALAREMATVGVAVPAPPPPGPELEAWLDQNALAYLPAVRVVVEAVRAGDINVLHHALGLMRALVHQACDQIEADKRDNPDRLLAWHLRFLEIGRKELARDVR